MSAYACFVQIVAVTGASVLLGKDMQQQIGIWLALYAICLVKTDWSE